MIDREQLKALSELEKKLKEKGVTLGQWGETKENEVENPMLNKQLEMWKNLKGMLVEQVEKDQSKIAELQEVLDRIKHGGGR